MNDPLITDRQLVEELYSTVVVLAWCLPSFYKGKTQPINETGDTPEQTKEKIIQMMEKGGDEKVFIKLGELLIAQARLEGIKNASECFCLFTTPSSDEGIILSETIIARFKKKFSLRMLTA